MLDAEGDVIDDACDCDQGHRCNYPPCVMERALEERRMRQLYGRRRPEDLVLAPGDVLDLADQLREAGR